MRVSSKTDKTTRGWVFGAVIPATYLLLELGFNFRLISIGSGTLNQEALLGLEFWGRILSGLGLGLAVFRLAMSATSQRLLLLAISVAGGIAIMWNVQIAIADYLVSTATQEDKLASVVLFQVSQKAAAGELQTLKGKPLASAEMSDFERNWMIVLFPAAALHVEDRPAQLAQWAAQSSIADRPENTSPLSPDDAYKNLVVLPIAFGLSILFAIINLSALLAFAVTAGSNRRRGILAMVLLILLAALSALTGRGFLDSEGYEGSMRAGIWQEKPLLAMLVEWSGPAAQTWSEASSFAGAVILRDFNFRKPSWAP